MTMANRTALPSSGAVLWKEYLRLKMKLRMLHRVNIRAVEPQYPSEESSSWLPAIEDDGVQPADDEEDQQAAVEGKRQITF